MFGRDVIGPSRKGRTGEGKKKKKGGIQREGDEKLRLTRRTEQSW